MTTSKNASGTTWAKRCSKKIHLRFNGGIKTYYNSITQGGAFGQAGFAGISQFKKGNETIL
ncbi:hypothetical protein K400107F7_14490 [Agathobaculum massiliense]